MNPTNTKVRRFLIEVARKKIDNYVFYQELSDQCDLGLDMADPYQRNVVMGEEILGEISRFEYKNGRPLLSALVIRQSDFQQGKGFYQLAEDLEIGKRKFLRDNNFSVEEMKKCYDFWCDETKYLKYKDIDVEE